MSDKLVFAVVAAVLGGGAAVPYIISIIRGHRPPYSTYLGWLLIGATGFVFHWQAIDPSSEKWSAFLPGVFALIPLTYLLLLVFLGAEWRLDRRDKICLSSILVCWLVWVVSHMSGISAVVLPLLALLATDAFSTWPILQDAWQGKESARPNQVSWLMTMISSVFGAMAVAVPWSSEMIYPGYLLVMMSLIAVFAILRAPGAGSREPGAGSREPGAGSREPGAGSASPDGTVNAENR